MDRSALTAEPGAYTLFIDLKRPLSLDATALGPQALAPGRYAYCGSAYGPGGLRARLGRHLRRDKALRWHVDHLTAAGRVFAVGLAPGGRECALVAALGRQAGVDVPLLGFGSSDCRRCPAHLLRLGPTADLDRLTRGLELVWIDKEA